MPVAETKRNSRAELVPVQERPRNFSARGISALLAPVLRPAFKRRAPAAAALLADWDALAGPDLAARAQPVKFAGGTLTLACTGPSAMELQLLAPQIIARLNLGLGSAMVERLRFTARAALAATPVPASSTAKPVDLPADLPAGPVGEALAALYRGMKARE